MPRVNVYIDHGTRMETPLWWGEFFSAFLPAWEVHWVSSKQILSNNPDHIIFPGGSASAFARKLGKKKRKQIKQWVEAGGSYIGVCAGAYLASAEWEWSLGILPLKIPDHHWKRGTSTISIDCIGGPLTQGNHQVLYANGPIFEVEGDLEIWATYESNLIAEKGTYQMAGTPAICHGKYHEGIVTLFGPHLEKTSKMRTELANAFEYIDKIDKHKHA